MASRKKLSKYFSAVFLRRASHQIDSLPGRFGIESLTKFMDACQVSLAKVLRVNHVFAGVLKRAELSATTERKLELVRVPYLKDHHVVSVTTI